MLQLGMLELPHGGRRPDLATTLPWPISIGHAYWLVLYPPKVEEIRAYLHEHPDWRGLWQWLQKNTRRKQQPKPQAAAYREEVAWRLRACRVRFGADDVAVQLVFHPPTARKPDLDNLKKLILDGAELGGVVNDDNQFVAQLTLLGDKVKGGSVDLRMWRS